MGDWPVHLVRNWLPFDANFNVIGNFFKLTHRKINIATPASPHPRKHYNLMGVWNVQFCYAESDNPWMDVINSLVDIDIWMALWLWPGVTQKYFMCSYQIFVNIESQIKFHLV